MSMNKYLQTAPLLEIKKYEADNNFRNVSAAYVGTPRKHPYDHDKLLLIDKPFGTETSFLEFRQEDILFAEDLPNIVTESGESLPVMRVWVRIGSFGIRFSPFEVVKQHT